MLVIVQSKWSKPNIITPKNSWPLQRRAHTTVQYKNFLVVFGGGNGQAALNDVWALNIGDPDELTWEAWKATGDVPVQKGYHTANLVGSKMVIYGGSDGNHSFSDVHVLNLGKYGCLPRTLCDKSSFAMAIFSRDYGMDAS
jgi:hypothetical protein